MVYHLGLPYQYEAIGKIAILPDHLYSTFPPFEQVLNLLFIHFGCESGVKVFSILLLFQIVYLFCGFIRWMTSDPQPTGGNGKDQSHWTLQMGGRIDLLVLAMLLFPAAWILIHIISADLLVTLFFCAGVISLVKTFDSVSRMTIVQSSLLLAFSAWTKSNVLIYFSFLPLLWLALARWRPSYGFWEIVWKHCGMILLFTLPLLLRNYFLLGDPLYPALSGIFSSKSWTPQQSAALQLDSLAGKNSGALEVLLAPLSITFRLDNYGSASEVGLVPLLSLLLYPFARKNRELNCVLFYVLFCYLAWLFTFHNFRQFLPPFYLFFLTAYFSFQYLFQRVRKFVPLIFGLCALYSGYQLLPIYSSFFPLISFGQRQTEYLEQHLSYFRLADVINKDPKNGKVAMLGETRIAYLTKPVVANTAYNQNPFLRMLKSSSSPDDLSSQLRHEEVKFVIVDRNEYLRLAKKYKIWEITPQEENILQDFLKNDTSFLLKSGDDYLFRIR